MAIQKTIEHNGVVIPYAYIKILNYGGDKTSVGITVGICGSSENVPFATEQYAFEPNLNGQLNFIAQGYEFLKTLPEFADAEDC